MASYRDLIEVTFVDNTSYDVYDSSDVVGVVLDYHWGPANQLLRLDRSAFSRYFPESIPVGAKSVPLANYNTFAQLKKAFDSGISRVEIYRPVPVGDNSWKYNQINFTVASTISGSATLSSTRFDPDADISFSLIYPGFLPQSFAPGCKNVGISLEIVNNEAKVIFFGTTGTTFTTIESFEGGFDEQQIVDGKPFYLPRVLENSQFIRCQVNQAPTSQSAPEAKVEFKAYSELTNIPVVDDTDDVITNILNTTFSDIQQSAATMFPATYQEKTVAAVQALAAKRLDCIAVVGYPLTNNFDKESILDYKSTLVQDMMSCFVVCRETVSIFGQKVSSNGVGGFCGKTALVASQYRINQCASAATYGKYSTTLYQALNFDDVLELHPKGVISIYNSITGPEIFGIRDLHSRQSSYFAQLNVARVTSRILAQIFPIAIEAIHTDAASNPSTRQSFSVRFNSVLGNFAAAQNIKNQSNADVGDQVNTDLTTQGGRIFNVVLNIWYIGLVEKVSIKIVATDSTITAEVI